MAPKQNMMQYTVVAKNEPGELNKIAQALAKENVNILGIVSQAGAEIGHIRFIAEQDQNVKKALQSLGLKAFETPVYRVSMQNKPGELARLTKALAEHDVNIELLYGTTDAENEARLVVALDKPEKVEKVLAAFAERPELAVR